MSRLPESLSEFFAAENAKAVAARPKHIRVDESEDDEDMESEDDEEDSDDGVPHWYEKALGDAAASGVRQPSTSRYIVKIQEPLKLI